MRYSSSMIVAIVISLFTFLGMSFLIASPKLQKSRSFEPINFSMLEDMKMSDVSKLIPPREKPIQEKVKQPPALAKLDIQATNERPEIEIPTGKLLDKNLKLDALDFNSINPPSTGLDKGGDLVQIAVIEPIYPQKALKDKIQGWVKVEFTVNEFGKVIHALVLDAQPKRVFDSATIRAITKSKFKPAMIDGKPVSQTAVQVIEFKIEK